MSLAASGKKSTKNNNHVKLLRNVVSKPLFAISLLVYSLFIAVMAQEYSIPAGPLSNAINQFAQISGIDVAMDANKLSGKTTAGLQGNYSVEEGFRILLENTGYYANKTANGYVINQIKNVEINNEVQMNSIIIRGQKIDRTQHNTMESVKVYDTESLESGTRTYEFFDLLDRTANIVRNDRFDFSIRGVAGIGPTGSAEGAPTISVYVDRAIQSSIAIQEGALSLWDVEQVELLRGPQSATQGRNALAGAVVVKTKDPEFETNGQLRVSRAEYDTLQTSIAHTGPITNNLAYRIAIDRQDTDNYVSNPLFNDFDEEENTLFRGKLLYKTDAGTKFLFTANDIRFDDRGNDLTVGDPFDRESIDNFDSKAITDSNTYTLDVNVPINNRWSFSSITSFINSDFDREADGDSFFTTTGEALILRDIDEEIFTQEFLFNYENDKTSALLGLYFADGKDDEIFASSGALLPIDSFEVAPGFFVPIPPTIVDFQSATEQDFRNAALFTNIDYKFASDWTLTAGFRLDYEERKNSLNTITERLTSTGNPLIDAGIDTFITGNSGASDGDDDFLVFLPRLGINYAWNDNMNAGFMVQRGYRSGGVSVNIIRAEAEEFDPEFTTNYELSFRSLWLDKNLSLNANIFYTEWEDQQVQIQGPLGTFDAFTENVAESNLWGFEVESTWRVNKEWSTNASIGYVKTEFDDFISNGADLSGNEFARAPRWTSNIGATYRNPNNGLFLTSNFSFVDKAFTQADNDIERDSFAIVNVRAGYERDEWAAYIFANNLFDREYITAEFDSPIRGFVPGAPQVVGATFEAYW